MLHARIFIATLSIFILSATAVAAQGEIVSIPFETIPENTSFAGSEPIELQADTEVTGDLHATGELSTDTGLRFPDGSFQATAGGGAGAGLTANAGLYGNTIADITPPNAYTEICVKNGDVFFDIHAAAEPTAGGNCLPGDTGWIIERFERDAGTALSWTNARMECLKDGCACPSPSSGSSPARTALCSRSPT